MGTYYIPDTNGWREDTGQYFYLRLKVEQSYNNSTNKSVLTITPQAKTSGGSMVYHVMDNTYLQANGITLLTQGSQGGTGDTGYRFPCQTNEWVDMRSNSTSTKSFSYTVSHNASGAASVSFEIHGRFSSDNNAHRSFFDNENSTLNLSNTRVFTLSINQGSGSTIAVTRGGTPLSNGASITAGDNLVISFGAATGYNLASHTVNGSSFVSGNTHTVAGNVSVVSTATASVSTISAQNGYFGQPISITVTRNGSYTHTITSSCLNQTETIVSKSSNTSISWTPSLPTYARLLTSSMSTTATLTCTTYSGNTNIGKHSISITISLRPQDVKPSATIAVTDSTGNLSTYGGYVVTKSKIQVSVTPTFAYDATLKATEIKANGATYTASPATTGFISSTSNTSVTAKITDSRGQVSATATQTITILSYSAPRIDSMSVHRCTSSGEADETGAYMRVDYSIVVSPLNNHNSKTLSVRTRKRNGGTWESQAITVSNYTASGSVVIPADTDYTYDVQMILKDDFYTGGVSVTTQLSSSSVLPLNFQSGGKGIGIGKVSEIKNAVELSNDWDLYFGAENFKTHSQKMAASTGVVIQSGANLDNYTTPGEYLISNLSVTNWPFAEDTGRLKVLEGAASGDCVQVAIVTSDGPIICYRQHSTADGWTSWSNVIVISLLDGTNGQVITKSGSGLAWSDAGLPTQQQVDSAISDWLDNNPNIPALISEEIASVEIAVNGGNIAHYVAGKNIASDGSLVDATGVNTSEKIPYTWTGSTNYYCGDNTSTQYQIAFYDANDGLLAKFKNPSKTGGAVYRTINAETSVTGTVAYVRFSFISTYTGMITNFTTGDVLFSSAATHTDGLVSEMEKAQEDIAALESLTSHLIESELGWSAVHLTTHHDGYYDKDGNFNSGTTRTYADAITVSPGDQFKISTKIGATTIPGILYFNGTTFDSYDLLGSGTAQDVVDYTFTVPAGVNKLIVQSTSYLVDPALSKYGMILDCKVYPKEETYSRDEVIALLTGKRYGVKWSVTDADDLGGRCFDAEGLTASIGVGSTNGSSDFDAIYPWSDIRRCNIVKNANGAEVVVFEGETGFALDGTNGDVFVRIPAFYYERYRSGGYEYRVVSRTGPSLHPAFIENGRALDAIYIGAFEGVVDSGGKLRSKGGVMPTSNITAQSFLTAAQANGGNYSLYDARCVDAVWTLLAVEFGCRNTNQILGYGLADFEQPSASVGKDAIVLAANATNTVRTIKWTSSQKNLIPVGGNITVSDTLDTNILTQAKLLSVTDDGDYTDWTFDGSAIDVTTDCFIGAAAFNTNFCEDVPSGALSWHTGRAAWKTGGASLIRNPFRYRWIENLWGNVWHFLPDITFYNRQMYVCRNMADYVMHKHEAPYKPENALYAEQSSNGSKSDSTGVNYWVSDMDNGQFTPGIDFGRSYDMSLTSEKAFGAYYYLAAQSDTPYVISNGGGFDHLYRCNMLTQRAWQDASRISYLYGARLMYKHLT